MINTAFESLMIITTFNFNFKNQKSRNKNI